MRFPKVFRPKNHIESTEMLAVGGRRSKARKPLRTFSKSATSAARSAAAHDDAADEESLLRPSRADEDLAPLLEIEKKVNLLLLDSHECLDG